MRNKFSIGRDVHLRNHDNNAVTSFRGGLFPAQFAPFQSDLDRFVRLRLTAYDMEGLLPE